MGASSDDRTAFVDVPRSTEVSGGGPESPGTRRALRLALLVPWISAALVLALSLIVGREKLERWNRDELGRMIAKAGTPEDVWQVEQGDDYTRTAVLALAAAGLMLLVLERVQRRSRDPFAGHWRPLGAEGISAAKLAWLLSGLVLVFWVHRLVRDSVDLETMPTYPLNVFQPILHATGLAFALAFVAVFFWAWCREDGSAALAWAVGLLLLFLGNLVQGGWFEGFVAPFVLSKIQYYHEALRIQDWRAWTAGFNEAQASLTNHARTHPPFAELVHWLPWKLCGVSGLSALFVLATSVAVPALHATLRALGCEAARAYRLSLLFAVLPAFNVYGAVCLDGLILAAGSVSLLGLVRIDRGPARMGDFLLFVGGLLALNLLSFGGLLPYAIAGLVGLRRAASGRWSVLSAVVLAALALVFAWLAMRAGLGYDHRQALATASSLENPDGFALFHDPADYIATRVEGFVEFFLFLSLAVVAWFLRGSSWRRDPSGGFAHAALAIFFLALALGTYRHGETARTCLFLYPYVLLALRDIPVRALDACLFLAALQTVLQQLTGFFFW